MLSCKTIKMKGSTQFSHVSPFISSVYCCCLTERRKLLNKTVCYFRRALTVRNQESGDANRAENRAIKLT
jgi:hypothetical protein